MFDFALCASGEAVPVTTGVDEVQMDGRPLGRTFDDCDDDAQCGPRRSCMAIDGLRYGQPCGTGLTCVCFPEKVLRCESSVECESGEVCAYLLYRNSTICVSADAEKSFRSFEMGSSAPGSNMLLQLLQFRLLKRLHHKSLRAGWMGVSLHSYFCTSRIMNSCIRRTKSR